MIDFDNRIKTVLDSYHQRIKTENELMKSLSVEEGMKRRDNFLLPIGPEVGQFINSLIKGAKSKWILEIGTSYGYSTLWLAEAASHIGATVITLELDDAKTLYAKEQITKAGLADHVAFITGDALEYIHSSNDSFDFVLLDIWKSLYLPCFEAFYPKLNSGAFIVADNMIHPPFHQADTEAYKSAIKKSASFDSILLPIGSGIEVSYLK